MFRRSHVDKETERAREIESVGENGTRNGATSKPGRENEENDETAQRDAAKKAVALRGHKGNSCRATRRVVFGITVVALRGHNSLLSPRDAVTTFWQKVS